MDETVNKNINVKLLIKLKLSRKKVSLKYKNLRIKNMKGKVEIYLQKLFLKIVG